MASTGLTTTTGELPITLALCYDPMKAISFLLVYTGFPKNLFCAILNQGNFMIAVKEHKYSGGSSLFTLNRILIHITSLPVFFIRLYQ